MNYLIEIQNCRHTMTSHNVKTNPNKTDADNRLEASVVLAESTAAGV